VKDRRDSFPQQPGQRDYRFLADFILLGVLGVSVVKTPPPIAKSAANSLLLRILPITPMAARICKESFFLTLCFQYFADNIGEGVKQWLVVSG
jgi:hypothetical protein